MHPEDPLARSPGGLLSFGWEAIAWRAIVPWETCCLAMQHGNPGSHLLSPSHPLSLSALPRCLPMSQGSASPPHHSVLPGTEGQKAQGDAVCPLVTFCCHPRTEWTHCSGFHSSPGRDLLWNGSSPPPPSSACVSQSGSLWLCSRQNKHVFLLQYVKTKLTCAVYSTSNPGATIPEKKEAYAPWLGAWGPAGFRASLLTQVGV